MSLPELRFVASPNYSARGARAVDLIVVHDCEGSFAGSVSWFAQARSKVSAHLVLSEDGKQAVQMVSWANKAWHACNFNGASEGLEAAGYMAKGLGAPEWEALASIVAFRLHARNLPPFWARGGVGPGFTQHADLGEAGGGHHDITSSPDVWAAFVKMVQAAYDQPQPPSWNAGASPDLLPTPPVGWKPSGTVRHDFARGSLEWVQMALNSQHSGGATLNVDGMDGPRTRNAVRAFQMRQGLPVTGEAGADTIAALAVA